MRSRLNRDQGNGASLLQQVPVTKGNNKTVHLLIEKTPTSTKKPAVKKKKPEYSERLPGKTAIRQVETKKQESQKSRMLEKRVVVSARDSRSLTEKFGFFFFPVSVFLLMNDKP